MIVVSQGRFQGISSSYWNCVQYNYLVKKVIICMCDCVYV